jgi:hypothetical protein
LPSAALIPPYPIKWRQKCDHRYLCCDGVGTGGEELGDTGHIVTSLSQAKGRSETGSSSPDHNRIKGMIHNRIGSSR